MAITVIRLCSNEYLMALIAQRWVTNRCAANPIIFAIHPQMSLLCTVMPVTREDFDKSPCNLLITELIILTYFIKTH